MKWKICNCFIKHHHFIYKDRINNFILEEQFVIHYLLSLKVEMKLSKKLDMGWNIFFHIIVTIKVNLIAINAFWQLNPLNQKMTRIHFRHLKSLQFFVQGLKLNTHKYQYFERNWNFLPLCNSVFAVPKLVIQLQNNRKIMSI